MFKKEIKKIQALVLQSFRQKGLKLNKIVLFGSQAHGKKKINSDIDLIIISKNFRNMNLFKRVEVMNGLHRELVKQIKKPFDILYYSDIEWSNNKSLIINEAKLNGNIL